MLFRNVPQCLSGDEGLVDRLAVGMVTDGTLWGHHHHLRLPDRILEEGVPTLVRLGSTFGAVYRGLRT